MKKRLAGIADLVGSHVVVCIDRKPLDENSLLGFVVGLSANLLLLHRIDGNSLQLDGYSAIRLSDIRAIRRDESFIGRALRLLERAPVVPSGIDISNWRSLIDSVQSRYPLLMAEFEAKEPGSGFIGQVVEQSPRKIRMETVDTKGKWEKAERFAVKDLTQIEFGGGYVDALTHLMAHEASYLEEHAGI